jgi:uncharacterized repeat protein (TIGR01451 family)
MKQILTSKIYLFRQKKPFLLFLLIIPIVFISALVTTKIVNAATPPQITVASYGPDAKEVGGVVSYVDAVTNWNIQAFDVDGDSVKMKIKQGMAGIDAAVPSTSPGYIQRDGPYSEPIVLDPDKKATDNGAKVPYTPPKPGYTYSYDYRAMDVNTDGTDKSEGPWRGERTFTVKNELPVVNNVTTSYYPSNKNHWINFNAVDPELFPVKRAEVQIVRSSTGEILVNKTIENSSQQVNLGIVACLGANYSGDFIAKIRLLDAFKRDTTAEGTDFWTSWQEFPYSVPVIIDPTCDLNRVVLIAYSDSSLAYSEQINVTPIAIQTDALTSPSITTTKVYSWEEFNITSSMLPLTITFPEFAHSYASNGYPTSGDIFTKMPFEEITIQGNLSASSYVINGRSITITKMPTLGTGWNQATCTIDCGGSFIQPIYRTPYIGAVRFEYEGDYLNYNLMIVSAFKLYEPAINYAPDPGPSWGVTNGSKLALEGKYFFDIERPLYGEYFPSFETSPFFWEVVTTSDPATVTFDGTIYQKYDLTEECTVDGRRGICFEVNDTSRYHGVKIKIKKKDSTIPGSLTASNLHIEKSASVATVDRGSSLTYTITYKNDTTSGVNAVNSLISDTVPKDAFSNMSGFSIPPLSDTIVGVNRVLTWNLGTVAPGETKTITYTATVSDIYPPGSLTNTASAMCSALANPITNTCTIDVVGTQCSLTTFSADRLSGNAPLPVTFTFGSPSNATSYVIDFDDDFLSANNPNSGVSHIYNAPGTFTATLSCLPGGASKSVSIIVAATNLQPNIVYTGDSIPNNDTGSINPAKPTMGVTVTDPEGSNVSAQICYQKQGETGNYCQDASPTYAPSGRTFYWDWSASSGLGIGTYFWWGNASDSVLTNMTVPRTFTVTVAPTLNCNVSPLKGEAPLAVKIQTTVTGTVAPPFQIRYYLSSGSAPALPQITDATAAKFITFDNPGVYTVQVQDPDFPLIGWQSCTTELDVKQSGSSDGGETTP